MFLRPRSAPTPAAAAVGPVRLTTETPIARVVDLDALADDHDCGARPSPSSPPLRLPPVHDPVTVDPAAVADLSAEPLSGLLVAWRWSDREKGRWAALVRVRTPQNLAYERWVAGEHVRRAATRVATQDAETEREGPVSWGKRARRDSNPQPTG